MSLVHDCHEQRKARLVRLGVRSDPMIERERRSFAAEIVQKNALIQRQLETIELLKAENAALKKTAEVIAAIPQPDTPAPAPEPPAPVPVTVANIVTMTCRHFGLSYVDIVGSRRTMECAIPRQIAVYLARTLTTRSLPEIGRRLGNRDHTTILHAYRKIHALVKQGDPVEKDIAAICSMLAVAP